MKHERTDVMMMMMDRHRDNNGEVGRLDGYRSRITLALLLRTAVLVGMQKSGVLLSVCSWCGAVLLHCYYSRIRNSS